MYAHFSFNNIDQSAGFVFSPSSYFSSFVNQRMLQSVDQLPKLVFCSESHVITLGIKFNSQHQLYQIVDRKPNSIQQTIIERGNQTGDECLGVTLMTSKSSLMSSSSLKLNERDYCRLIMCFVISKQSPSEIRSSHNQVILTTEEASQNGSDGKCN